MDSTYKTNRYKMPLFHTAARSPTGQFFSVGFCFLSGEAQDDYQWALEIFKEVACEGIKTPNAIVVDSCRALILSLQRSFPTTPILRCLFHINEAVKRKVSDAWKNEILQQGEEAVQEAVSKCMAHWHAIVNALTIPEHLQRCCELYEFLDSENKQGLKSYFTQEWLERQGIRETFCIA
jgi:hypothetical protein